MFDSVTDSGNFGIIHNKNGIDTMIFKINRVVFSRFLLLTGFLVLFPGSVLKTWSDGLPGEYILSDQWRTFSKYYSPNTNPALMMENLYTSIRGVISLSSDEAAKLWETGVVVPVGIYHTAGFSVIGENGHEVKDFPLEGTTYKTSKNSNYLFTLSYATNPWRRINAGLNLNLAYQGNFGDSPSLNIGMDLGVTCRVLLHPVLGFHVAGLTFQNLLAPKLSELDKMPFSTKAYYHASMLNDRIDFDLEFDITDLFTSKDFFDDKKYLEWDFFLQGGFWVLPFVAVKGFTNVGHSGKFDFWGAAVELNVPQVNGGRDLSFLYQFREEIKNELQGTHSLYFRADVGRSREEIRNRRIARVVNLNSSELYNKAMKLYHKGDYWNAYFLYQRILIEFPDFHQNDRVTYFAGSCLEEMDMREESKKMYNSVKQEYSLSSIVPNSDLGLMRIHYRQGDYDSVYNQYIELNRQGVSDSIRAHGNYIMGETAVRQGEYDKALQYFDQIPDTHPVYVFAQHSAATALALMDTGDMNGIISRLDNCVSASVTGKSQKEIVNRSLVLLGYVYYEENSLSKAVSALRMVPPESYYYEDALLGLGWTAIKARQWRDCINAGATLAGKTKRFVIQAEAALLQAYGYMLEKNFLQAQNILSPIAEKMDSFTGFSEDSLTTEKMRYENNRLSYAFLAERVTNTARKGQAAKQQTIDSLHNDQLSHKQKIDDYLLFAEEAKRTKFFERPFETIKSDIEYALANIQKIVNASAIQKETEKIINKDKEINDEIEKLKEEMENLENDSDTQ